MKTITLSLATLSACLATLTSASTLFSGDFLLSNVVVDAPFQAYPNSTQSSIIYCNRLSIPPPPLHPHDLKG